jgi:hypothetical protein
VTAIPRTSRSAIAATRGPNPGWPGATVADGVAETFTGVTAVSFPEATVTGYVPASPAVVAHDRVIIVFSPGASVTVVVSRSTPAVVRFTVRLAVAPPVFSTVAVIEHRGMGHRDGRRVVRDGRFG